jgi:hypothetical protein
LSFLFENEVVIKNVMDENLNQILRLKVKVEITFEMQLHFRFEFEPTFLTQLLVTLTQTREY